MRIHPVLAVAAVLVLLRLPAALMANQGLIIDFDEMTMTLNTADRFLGVPHVTTGWPGGTVQLITMPLMALAYLIQSHLDLSASSFIDYLANLYRYPWHAIALTRAPVVVVSSLGIAMLWYPLAAITSKTWIRILAIILTATLPFVWTYSQMATTDGMALGMVCASLGILGRKGTPHRPMIAGALFGLGIASKVTYLLSAPFIIAILILNSEKLKKELLSFASFATLGFIFACPYVWTDPIRYAKGVLGMSAKQGVRPTFGQLFELFTRVSTIPFLGLYGLGLARFAKRRQTTLLLGAIATWLLSMAVFSRSDGYVYDRYFLPNWVAFMFCVTAGLDLISNKLTIFLSESPNSRWPALALTTVIGLPLLISNASTYADLFTVLTPYRATPWPMVEDIKSTSCRRNIIIQQSVFPYFTQLASNASLDQTRRNLEAVNQRSREQVVTTIASRSIEPIWVRYINSNFNAQEQSIAARLKVMQYKEPTQPLDIKIWGGDRESYRFGYLTDTDVKAMVAKGEVCALIGEAQSLRRIGIKSVPYGFFSMAKFRT